MSLILHREQGEVFLKDERDRVLMVGKGDDIAIARFPDLDDSVKKYMADLYSDLTDKSYQEVRDFLDYKSEEEEFCS